MSNKKKSIAAIIAAIALVSILAVCLCACGEKTDGSTTDKTGGPHNKPSKSLEDYIAIYENLGYEVEALSFDETTESDLADELGVDSVDIVNNYVVHESGSSMKCVWIFQFSDATTAKKYREFCDNRLSFDNYGVAIDGTIVIWGDKMIILAALD